LLTHSNTHTIVHDVGAPLVLIRTQTFGTTIKDKLYKVEASEVIAKSIARSLVSARRASIDHCNALFYKT